LVNTECKNIVFGIKTTRSSILDIMNLNFASLNPLIFAQMAIKIIHYLSPEYLLMVDLRREVLRKPLGLEFSPQDLEKDEKDILIAAFDGEIIIGCCILTKESADLCKLRQMAVHQNHQRKNIGASILRFAETIAIEQKFSTLCMHARQSAIGFYEKLGYTICSETFLEVNIPHVAMEKKLSTIVF
jgi:predicted GNAT family N-acyltransferase